MKTLEKTIAALAVVGALAGCLGTSPHYVGPPKRDVAGVCSGCCAAPSSSSAAYVASPTVAPVNSKLY